MRRLEVFTIGLTLLMLALSALSVLAQEQPKAPSNATNADLALSQEDRVAIVKDATQTLQKYFRMKVEEREGNEIPQRFWGEAILKLKPVRVLDDRVNIAIVLRDDEHTEQGLYVANPISSSITGYGKVFALWEKLSKPEDKSFGELYQYGIEKSKAPKAS